MGVCGHVVGSLKGDDVKGDDALLTVHGDAIGRLEVGAEPEGEEHKESNNGRIRLEGRVRIPSYLR